MREDAKAGFKPKQAQSAERRARLSRELRANLLKRKAQAKEKEASSRNRDEGRQS